MLSISHSNRYHMCILIPAEILYAEFSIILYAEVAVMEQRWRRESGFTAVVLSQRAGVN